MSGKGAVRGNRRRLAREGREIYLAQRAWECVQRQRGKFEGFLRRVERAMFWGEE